VAVLSISSTGRDPDWLKLIIISDSSKYLYNGLRIYMTKRKPTNNDNFKVRILADSVKFYLPRVEGYLEVVRNMASKYRGMSLIEFDGYFEGKFEPVKYVRAEIHISKNSEQSMTKLANEIRKKLKQKSLAMEFNNRLILVSE
jgi:hypothetical protein